jgi:hypothetical protein
MRRSFNDVFPDEAIDFKVAENQNLSAYDQKSVSHNAGDEMNADEIRRNL